ncbi:MAG TPA: ATP-binding protein [Candidatus Limnocylindrales bacterium]|jgi:two-component system sensor histidine kinase KdpD|nr:ATP-binding protein [Candidatus Limnocylindrales bacterium]
MHRQDPTKRASQWLAGRGIWQTALRAIPSSIVVGITTFACFTFHVNFPTVSFIYLIIVVLQSLTGDFLSSAVVSVVAFLCLNFFFVPPIFSLAVSDSSDTLALISFLITGLVVTRLTSRARKAADSAALQRTETTRLYELARELLASDPNATVGIDLLKPFKSQFSLGAVCLFDAVTAQLQLDGESLEHLAEKTRTAYISECNFQDRDSGVAVRLLRNGDHFIGAIGFEGLHDVELTAEPLAALAAVMMERARAFHRASHAAAATEAEMFRGAVLDALAHEFKTPLATIITAASGLREAGPLRSEQKELAEIIESEASRLGQLTSRLLRLARLDRDEVKPRMELTDLGKVVKSVVNQYVLRWPDRRLQLIKSDRVDVLADQELLRMGLGQLLDNACKYSGTGSDIRVSIENANEAIAVRVWNNGTPIPAGEQARIFERFYRGVDARRQTPGTGLGLYVARKIALAHGGNLGLEGPEGGGAGTAFRFTMPVSRNELGHDTEI